MEKEAEYGRGREREREPRSRPWNQSNCFHSSHEYLELCSPKLFGCPNTAFHCFRVSQRWVFEPRRAKPQTPLSSRSGRSRTQVVSERHISLRQQKPVSLNGVCLFCEIQEPQAEGFNQDPRWPCGNWGSSTQDLGPRRLPNARRELVPTDGVERLPLTWPPADAGCPEDRLAQAQASF